MLSRLVLAALIYPPVQAGLFGLGIAAHGAAWLPAVDDPIQQAMAAALLVGMPLAWGVAPLFERERDDRFRRRLRRLARRRLRPEEVRWPPLRAPGAEPDSAP